MPAKRTRFAATSVVVEDEALAEHLIGTFDTLRQAAPGRQEALVASWEARRR